MIIHFYKYTNKRWGKFNTHCQKGMLSKPSNCESEAPFKHAYYGDLKFDNMTTSENVVTCEICIEELVRIHRKKIDLLLRKLCPKRKNGES